VDVLRREGSGSWHLARPFDLFQGTPGCQFQGKFAASCTRRDRSADRSLTVQPWSSLLFGHTMQNSSSDD
jgi:hypothetical protein